MTEPVLHPSRDIHFPVFDAVADDLGRAAWGGWRESSGVVDGVSRVRGGAPHDEDGPAGSLPGVAVWSFAPEPLSGPYSGPSRTAVLPFGVRFADRHGMSLRAATESLLDLVSSGGAAVTVTVDGEPVPGLRFEIAELGRLVTSVEPARAFAATYFLTPVVPVFRRLIDLDV
ncbi:MULTISPECIES: hypothetical protein [Actinoplanes]|uniref:hypothetical protein n=1 Tax=Actinoplanes TaxID=1865 RepID=UPI0012F7497C|nr:MULTISPECIES: hypothetical protein [Actinoplanes]